MFIEFEKTPNPLTLKFIPGRLILANGTAEFKSIDEAQNSPLALRLFDVEGVTAVFFAKDFLSVSCSESYSWDELKPVILTELMEHFTADLPIMAEVEPKAEGDRELSSEIEMQIKELIDTRVKPAVAMDGGNIEFVEFDDGVVYLRLEGACSGCPSAALTLKDGVENMLKHFIPEVEAVEAL